MLCWAQWTQSNRDQTQTDRGQFIDGEHITEVIYGGSDQDSDWGMMKTGGSGGDRRGLGCSVRGAKVRPGVSHCPPPKAWAGSAVSAWLPCYLANLMQNTFQLLISMYAFTDLSTHLQKTIANLNRFWVSFFTQLQIWLCTSGLR